MKKALFLAILIVTALGTAQAELPQYVMRDLGFLGADLLFGNVDRVRPTAINDLGWIVGSTYLKDGTEHAFYWNGSYHDLGQGRASGVNDSGLVAGSSWDTQTAWYWDGQRHTLDLGQARAVNSMGQVAGQVLPDYAAIIWQTTGGQVTLGNLGGPGSIALALNDAGVAVGQSDAGPFVRHAFLWDGTMHDLGTLGGRLSAAYDINATGLAVGTAYGPTDPVTEIQIAFAVMWGADRTPTALWPGGALAVNDHGLILGSGPDGDYRMIWMAGQVATLPLGNATLGAATQLNNNGVLVGWADSHVVIWEPVPEPGTFAGLLAGVGWFTAYIRLRNRQ